METVDLPQRNSPPPPNKEKRKIERTNKQNTKQYKIKKNDMNLREVNLPVSQRLFGIQFYEHFT